METKNLAHYMALPYTYSVIPDPDEGGYVIKVNELPGCLSQGDTVAEAIERVQEAKEAWLDSALKHGDPIPTPDGEDYSGKFVVRVPKSVHRALAAAAEREGVSLNLYVASALAGTVGAPVPPNKKSRPSPKAGAAGG